MPCSECRLPRHSRPTCPQLNMNRVLSIINDGTDLAPFNMQNAEWFKDVDGKSPMDLEWKGPSIGHYNSRDYSHASPLLQKLRWLIKEIPTNVDNRTPITNIVYQKGALWYSYTYDTERKILSENLFADELTGAPIQADIARQTAVDIDALINRYTKAQTRREAAVRRNAEYQIRLQEYRDRVLAAPNAAPRQWQQDPGVVATQQRRQQQLATQQRRIEIARRRELRERLAIQDFQKKVDALPPPASKIIDCDECPICMEPLGQTNIVVLRCGHKTCGDCIFHHFQRSAGTSCPSCRQDFAVRLPGWTPPAPVY